MDALRCAPLLMTLLLAGGCSKKTEVHEDPAAKPAVASAAATPTIVASTTVAPSTVASTTVEPSTAEPSTVASSFADATAPRVAPKRIVKMIETGTDIKGPLPPEVVKRIIRANFPRFRACYDRGLKANPSLKGTVSVRFVIDATGAVGSVTSSGGSLPDKSVTQCVVDVFGTLSFPEPDGPTKVTVTYPIEFENEIDDSPHVTPQQGLGGVGGFGGCPCGCDHSEDMVAELRGLGRDEALRAIDDSLRTIGEREDAGYITDRMVRHRLRLVAYGSELGRLGPARFTSIPALREGVSGAVGSTNVRAQFIFHGETTELVNGKPKLLRAAFVLRLELENRGAADVTLREPALAGDTPLPVSRWYVAGGDGQAWDGVLRPATKVLVHVIGYAGEPVPPGTPVRARVHLESLSLEVKARARHSWNQVD